MCVSQQHLLPRSMQADIPCFNMQLEHYEETQTDTK